MENTTLPDDNTLNSEVAAVRSFNRFFTRKLGVLRTGHLDSPWSLTEVRILYELLHRERTRAPELRRALDMDPGQLSRVLSKLEGDGLLTRSPSPDDARSQEVVLTTAGSRAAATLDGRSNAQIRELIGHLSVDGRRRLVSAMTAVRQLLEEPEERQAPTVVLRPLRSGDAGWVIERHGALYFEEYGWDETFEALVAEIAADYLRSRDPRTEYAWIAEVDGERAGCVFCARKDETTAKLRLLLVEPTARGLGIGGRLVEECLSFARSAGYARMTLWTNDCLTAARRIYQRAGFQLVHAEKHRSFGHELVGQTWERDL
ncbi:DNA-binding MarR family transcriptional regulator/GNAT superfamily N-acetyltransferase [Lipingzhangella halophila]|uniref:DNA-binding MarR family transcriptional regulator/GNAT superfamily N-acetyltransferase n=1 Tax=Lipingzhangella halophila TaxID=1783352 RepID=A0A7W7RCM3_9ACTN|nr:helix-turn-helix domain-containing GNAT family N-acetyltransferase [Lipingzhangella halophila]MBB4929509.1 DNA-binding MarR family transcriptional regulator/GNAT superfamily N-acetyltransferase [Lipingzhangella halophila]